MLICPRTMMMTVMVVLGTVLTMVGVKKILVIISDAPTPPAAARAAAAPLLTFHFHTASNDSRFVHQTVLPPSHRVWR